MECSVKKGRPENTDGRLEKEIKVYDTLDKLGITYDRMDHAPVMTMEACQEIDKALGVSICKNLFLCNRRKTEFYLLMISDYKTFRTKELSAQIGSARLSFADACFMEEYLDVAPGSVSVMGLMNDRYNHVRLLVDEDVLKARYIGCHPCVNTSSLKLRTQDVFQVFVPHTSHEMSVVNIN